MNRFPLVLCISVAIGASAQSTIAISTARSSLATAGATSASAGSSGSSASSASSSAAWSPSASGTKPLGDGTSFAEIPGKRDPNKKIVVPESLRPKVEPTTALGALGPNDAPVSLGDQAKHFQDAKAVAKPQPVRQLAAPLHFDVLMAGIDPVSVTVRDLQSFANEHTRSETEVAVRKWFKEGSEFLATNPATMRRKESFVNSVAVLRSVGFPPEWLEAPKPEIASTK